MSQRKPKITIEIPIPQKLADAREWISYQYRKIKLQINPFRCDCCGKKMYTRNAQYEYEPEGRYRLLVENLKFKHTVCRACIVNELETKQWTPRFNHSTIERYGVGAQSRHNYRFWSTKKCDVTGSSVRSFKDVEILPHIDMTFCTIAWNYGRVSKQAVIDCVKYGDVKTSRWGVWKKQKMMPMNERGLFIDQEGNLL